jgi:hypothetical protein
MKLKTGLFLFVSALIFTSTVIAQDAQTIIKNHNEAMGGLKKWENIKTLILEGTMSIMGLDMPLKMSYIRDKGMRQDFSVMGSECYVILTANAGWKFIPPQGDTAPVAMSSDEMKGTGNDLSFENKLMTSFRRNAKFELQGRENVNGVSCHKLKVTNPDNKVYTCYVDPTTWYLLKTSETANVQGQDMEVETVYSKHTRQPSGIVVALEADSGEGGKLTYTKVSVNTIEGDAILKP